MEWVEVQILRQHHVEVLRPVSSGNMPNRWVCARCGQRRFLWSDDRGKEWVERQAWGDGCHLI